LWNDKLIEKKKVFIDGQRSMLMDGYRFCTRSGPGKACGNSTD
jgi:hypothetical protein